MVVYVASCALITAALIGFLLIVMEPKILRWLAKRHRTATEVALRAMEEECCQGSWKRDPELSTPMRTVMRYYPPTDLARPEPNDSAWGVLVDGNGEPTQPRNQ